MTSIGGEPVLLDGLLPLALRCRLSDGVDGLIRVDLRETDPQILHKYMGRDDAQAFISYHRENSRKAG